MSPPSQDGIRVWIPWDRISTPGVLTAGMALLLLGILVSARTPQAPTRREAIDAAGQVIGSARAVADHHAYGPPPTSDR